VKTAPEAAHRNAYIIAHTTPGMATSITSNPLKIEGLKLLSDRSVKKPIFVIMDHKHLELWSMFFHLAG
jgi:hypothetical protein